MKNNRLYTERYRKFWILETIRNKIMIQLPEEIGIGGFRHTQVKRIGNLAIYGKWLGNILIGYEVIKIQVRNPQESMFRYKPQVKEYYPPTTSWGKYGFSYKHLKDAERKFDELLEKSSKKSKETVIKSVI